MKCKCLYDTKSLTIYAITIAIITLAFVLSYDMIHINTDIALWWVFFILVVLAIIIAIIITVKIIIAFCKESEPRPHIYLIYASMLVITASVLLILTLPLIIGGYYNLNIVYDKNLDVSGLSCFQINNIHRINNVFNTPYGFDYKTQFFIVWTNGDHLEKRVFQIPEECINA